VPPGLEVDGRSLLPLLQGAPTDWRRRFLVEYPPAGEWLGIPPFFAVREDSGLIYGETLNFAGTQVTDVELYDLATDPYQQQSQHRNPSPGRARQMHLLKERLDLLKHCGGGTCQTLEQ
jgi:hypothetical protein